MTQFPTPASACVVGAHVRDLGQRPASGETTNFDPVQRHHCMTHEHINPTRMVPRGPVVDGAAPHGRGRLGP